MRKMPKKLIENSKLRPKTTRTTTLQKYLEFLDDWEAVKDVEQPPIEHTPVLSHSLITPKYLSAHFGLHWLMEKLTKVNKFSSPM